MSKAVKRYRYEGPVSGVTLREGKSRREVMLQPGREVELPSDNPHVAALVARRHLIEVAPAPAPAPARKATKQEEK